jgi:hypothetical protein
MGELMREHGLHLAGLELLEEAARQDNGRVARPHADGKSLRCRRGRDGETRLRNIGEGTQAVEHGVGSGLVLRADDLGPDHAQRRAVRAERPEEEPDGHERCERQGH